jgi:hypothetical protein
VLTAAVVLAVPFGQVGASVDFAMRASIPALALLAIMMARLVIDAERWPEGRSTRRIVLVVWAIGLLQRPWARCARPDVAPRPGGDMRLSPGRSGRRASYVAPLARLSRFRRPHHHRPQAAHMLAGGWKNPMTGLETTAHPY